MSFIEPNLGQVQKNQKILQELEEKKRRMRSATGPTLDSSPIVSSLSSPFTTIQSAQQQQQSANSPSSYNNNNNGVVNFIDINTSQSLLPPKQTPPYSLFQSNSTVGYFINTDSTFGNQILPVLPRF